jgi:hypothetical protein
VWASHAVGADNPTPEPRTTSIPIGQSPEVSHQVRSCVPGAWYALHGLERRLVINAWPILAEIGLRATL